jgi:F420-dependent oxidoreductase-like protein
MRVGLQVPSFTWPDAPASIGPRFGHIAQKAEQAGVDSLWVMDHFFQIRNVGAAEEPMLEGYTALAYAAAVTERVKLGTMVTGVTYRHPGILVKTVTTLDVLSGGRAYFGIGAAWNDEEHAGLGVPYPPTAERFERLEETLQIAIQMWRGDESPYQGTHYQLARPLNSPQSISRPHPPILIGGTGERKTLRMVAQYADACNIFDGGDEFISGKLAVLREHCERLGRPYEEIEKTSLGTMRPDQSVDEVAARVTQLAALGVDSVLLNCGDRASDESLDVLAGVVAKVADVVPAGR